MDIQKKCTKQKGYPGVFAYDYFESKKYYGCGAGFNYLFVDAQGNLSPCDFTMVSFGNLRDRPIRDIWEETSSHFRIPGCKCYANVISQYVASRRPRHWPLNYRDSRQVVEDCPPYDTSDIPEFYRRVGFRAAEKS